MDAGKVYQYTAPNASFDALELAGVRDHYFAQVPIIEYHNNTETQGDFVQQLSLIDAYNTLMSDRVNDKKQFVDTLLLLVNIDLDSQTSKKLKEKRLFESGLKERFALYNSFLNVKRNMPIRLM